MKFKILFLAISLLVVNSLFADQFQLIYREKGNTYYVSHSNVKVFDARKKLVYDGYTDKYGRLTIEIRAGQYSGKVNYRQKIWSVTFLINGSKELRTIYLN